MSHRSSIEYRRHNVKQVSFACYVGLFYMSYMSLCICHIGTPSSIAVTVWSKFRLGHIWKSHVSYMNGSCHTHERVMSHIWMGPDTHMKESCHTYEWVLSHTWKMHVTHMNGSWHTYEWFISLVWMGPVTHMNESCHTYEWVMSQRLGGVDSFICVTWHIDMCDMTHSYVWRDSFVCVTWRIQVCNMPMKMSHVTGVGGLRGVDSFIRVTWRIRVCDMTHSSLQHAYINEACHRRGRAEGCGLIHMCDMTYSCVWHDAFKSATWLYRWVMPQGGMGWGAWTNGAALWKRHVLEVISFLGLFSRSPV